MFTFATVFHWFHLLAVVAWIGGIIYVLTILLPAMPQVALRDRANFVPLLLRRFLALVWISIGAILLTGLYHIFFVWDATAPGFFGSPLGRTLIEKWVLAAALIGVAAKITLQVAPRAIAHVHTHRDDAPDAYKCPQCLKVIGGLKRHLQVALGIAALTILWATRL
jgi:uncharacterized membrane protein